MEALFGSRTPTPPCLPAPRPHTLPQVSRSTFTNCEARNNHGGAIQFSYIYTPPLISECTFQNTRAAGEGGAIHASGGPGMRVSGRPLLGGSVSMPPSWRDPRPPACGAVALVTSITTAKSGGLRQPQSLPRHQHPLPYVNQMSVTRCTFTNTTTASGTSGAVMFIGDNMPSATFTRNTIVPNAAMRTGPVVCFGSYFPVFGGTAVSSGNAGVSPAAGTQPPSQSCTLGALAAAS